MNQIGKAEMQQIVEKVVEDLLFNVDLECDFVAEGDKDVLTSDFAIRRSISDINSLDNLTASSENNRTSYLKDFHLGERGVTCDKCFIRFPLFNQWESHSAVFHTGCSADLWTIVYDCLICKKRFDNLNLFLSHSTCQDKSKQRLGLSDGCLCPICGCAVLRGHLYGHLISQHDAAIKELCIGDCLLCKPVIHLKSKLEALCHLSTWHPLAFLMQLQQLSLDKRPIVDYSSDSQSKGMTVDEKKEEFEFCHLCGQKIEISEFPAHVVAVHCNGEKGKKLSARTVDETRTDRKRRIFSSIAENHLVKQPKAKKSIPKKDRLKGVVKQTQKPEKIQELLNGGLVETLEPFICKNCNTECKTQECFCLHIVEQKCEKFLYPIYCSVCGGILMNWQMYGHLVSQHCDQLGLDWIEEKDRMTSVAMFICGVQGYCRDCGLHFTDPNHDCSSAAGSQRFPCNLCNIIFLDRMISKVHLSLFHRKNEPVTYYGKKTVPVSELQEVVRVCKKSQADLRRVLLRRQLRLHANDSSYSYGQDNSGEENLTCKFCNASFNSSLFLDIHMGEFHSHQAVAKDWMLQTALKISNAETSWEVPTFERMAVFWRSEELRAQARQQLLNKVRSEELRARARQQLLNKVKRFTQTEPNTTAAAQDNKILTTERFINGHQTSQLSRLPVSAVGCQKLPEVGGEVEVPAVSSILGDQRMDRVKIRRLNEAEGCLRPEPDDGYRYHSPFAKQHDTVPDICSEARRYMNNSSFGEMEVVKFEDTPVKFQYQAPEVVQPVSAAWTNNLRAGNFLRPQQMIWRRSAAPNFSPSCYRPRGPAAVEGRTNAFSQNVTRNVGHILPQKKLTGGRIYTTLDTRSRSLGLGPYLIRPVKPLNFNRPAPTLSSDGGTVSPGFPVQQKAPPMVRTVIGQRPVHVKVVRLGTATESKSTSYSDAGCIAAGDAGEDFEVIDYWNSKSYPFL